MPATKQATDDRLELLEAKVDDLARFVARVYFAVNEIAGYDPSSLAGEPNLLWTEDPPDPEDGWVDRYWTYQRDSGDAEADESEEVSV